MMNQKFSLTIEEFKLFKKLNTPQKIQDFINQIPMNFEKDGETCLSPRQVLKQNTAHCFEGALLATAILWFHGQRPLLLDLKTTSDDFDHVVALFKKFGHWGAISKTNHGVLRYREPIYRNIRELAISYFHEYYLENGKKTLRTYSNPFSLAGSADWVTSEEELWHLPEELDKSPHHNLLTPNMIKNLRKVDQIEIKAGDIPEWEE